MDGRILRLTLVDDDADDRDFFRDALDSMGIPVALKMYKDGKDLLDAIKTDKFEIPDILFLDLNMPKISGMESLREIRMMDKFKEIPIIAIYSTSSSAKDKEDSLQNGADAYICKPTNFGQLIKVLKKVIEIDWDSRQRDAESFLITA